MEMQQEELTAAPDHLQMQEKCCLQAAVVSSAGGLPRSMLRLLLTQGSIEGRRDIAGGRSSTDRRAAGNLASGACFTSLAFSADGSFLLAGGASKCAPMVKLSSCCRLSTAEGFPAIEAAALYSGRLRCWTA